MSSGDRRLVECKHLHIGTIVITKGIVSSIGIAAKHFIILVLFFVFLAEPKSFLVVRRILTESIVIIGSSCKSPNAIVFFTIRRIICLLIVIIKARDLATLVLGRNPTNDGAQQNATHKTSHNSPGRTTAFVLAFSSAASIPT